MQRQRPLLPAAGADTAGPVFPNIQRQKRKQIGSACESCRLHKSKCNGQMPSCSACSSRNVQCVYTSDPNVTRTLATKRKYEALEEDLTAIRELYAHLQSRPNREATEIFQRIRSGADPISVLRFIQDGDLLIQPFLAAAAHNQTAHKSILGLSLREPDLYLFRFLPRSQENGSAEEVINTSFVNDGRSLHGDVDELLRNYPSHRGIPGFEIADDARLKQIPSKRWTTVVCDETLFADLLTLYFTIEHPFFALFDKDLFLDDLVAGRARFCSSLIVNAVLGLACHYSAQIEHRGQPWNDRNLGSHFFREARRLWQIEESKASLTAIQAALLICFSLNIDGKDKVGWTFVSQAVQMSQDLGLFAALPPARVNSSERNSDNLWNHARAVTAWAVFNFETMLSFHIRLPPLLLQSPSFPIPYPNKWQTERESLCSQSQETSREFPVEYFNAMQKANCDLYIILHEIATLYLSPNMHSTGSSAGAMIGFYNRLLDWHEKLPAILLPDASILPQHFVFHFNYHSSILALIRMPTVVAHFSSLSPGNWDEKQAERISRLSLRQMRLYVKRYASIYNFKSASAPMMQFLLLPAYDCLQEMHLQESREIFDLCYRGLEQLSNGLFLVQAITQGIRVAAERTGIVLPPLILTNQQQNLTMLLENIYSSFPAYCDSPGLQLSRLDSLMKSISDLSFGDTTIPPQSLPDSTES